jgi:hypothetical protein
MGDLVIDNPIINSPYEEPTRHLTSNPTGVQRVHRPDNATAPWRSRCGEDRCGVPLAGGHVFLDYL